jgi:DNA polymerase-1
MKKLFHLIVDKNVKLRRSFNFKSFTSINLNDNLAFKSSLKIPSVTIVRDRNHAKKCVEILKSAGNRFHAWDTETLGIDPRENSPVTHGRIICFSCFAGPDLDFGNGPRLFIDNYAECRDLVSEFKEYFENPSYLKVWHNYGFDRHIFYHHGINVQGFGADTLHMARMYDTSKLPNEFSLGKLSEIYHDELIKMRKYYLNYLRKLYSTDQDKLNALKAYEGFNGEKLKKIDMKTLFQYKKVLRTGEEGKTWVMPEIEELHTNPKYIKEWIIYSVLDAEVTYYLRDIMQILLESLSSSTKSHKNPVFSKYKNNYALYINYWRPFGELMTEMERVGIKIDLGYLRVLYI